MPSERACELTIEDGAANQRQRVGRVTALALVLLVLALVPLALGWWVPAGDRRHLAMSVAGAAALGLVGLVVLLGDGVSTWPSTATNVLVLVTSALAVVGGGPVTVAVLRLADRGVRPDDLDSVERAGEVLRGGAWIGALERAAVFASVVSGWPEGLAVVLAVKGIARYPELRGSDDAPATPHGVAERFIIGTFVSVLWAVACAGVVLS